MKFAKYYILFSVIFVSCQKSEPHRTQSEYFNSLLDSAPIHIIDIETPSSDTLYFTDDKTFCVNGLLGDQGVRSVMNMHLFNDTINVLADANGRTLWALDTQGSVTRIAGSGNGPGEVLIPTYIHSLSDTLFIYDTRFVHAFDNSIVYPEMKIEFSFIENKFICKVFDNGLGFDPKGKKSKGLDLIKERIKLLNPSIKTSVVVKKTKKGTTVAIEIPIR